MTHLLQLGSFILHSGQKSNFKIECDALTDDDWKTAAILLAERLNPFGHVIAVPTGGLKLAAELTKFTTKGYPPLLADDVWTTGTSMRKTAQKQQITKFQGAVLFARTKPPKWVKPLFLMQ